MDEIKRVVDRLVPKRAQAKTRYNEARRAVKETKADLDELYEKFDELDSGGQSDEDQVSDQPVIDQPMP
jgi:hypothetical protein